MIGLDANGNPDNQNPQFPSPETITNNAPSGSFDSVGSAASNLTIYGWGQDPDNTNVNNNSNTAYLNIGVYDGNNPLTVVAADQFRADLTGAFANHAFSANLARYSRLARTPSPRMPSTRPTIGGNGLKMSMGTTPRR
jgi:hypothetical protein